GEANLLPGTVEGRDGGVACVAVAGGTVSVPDSQDASGPVLVMVRPEKVRVGREAPSGTHAGIPATVDEVIFRGATVHVGLVTADGANLVAHLTDDRALDGLRPRDPAWASWEQDVAYLVPAAGGHSAAPPDPLEELAAKPLGGTP
ncbi:MAG TPA: TOBE domain-containing protein, partial [Acidimicrobiia bacterium]|nr:TOBE domain-containing protein [Acidimicrobiia bacterium]